MKTFLLAIAFFQMAAMTATAAPSCCTTNVPVAAPLTDASVYQLESEWTSDKGEAVRLNQLRGKVQVVTMFFASCAYVCPVLVNNAQEIESKLRAAGVEEVEFVLVTFDTENDTLEKLHSYRQQRHLGNNWRLLRGGSEDVAELAALLGVKYKKEPSGQYAHSNVITILDKEGEIVHQQIGLNVDPAGSLAAINKALDTSK
jgi:protein SCO1/2